MENIKDLADFCLNLDTDAKYVEVRAISGESKSLMSRNGELLTAGTSFNSGIGIRVLVDGGLGFTSFTDLSKQSAKEAMNTAISLAKKSNRKNPISLGEPVVSVDKWKTPYKQSLLDVDFDTFLSINSKYDEAIKSAESQLSDVKIPNANFLMDLKTYKKYILTSEGTDLESTHEEIYGYSSINAASSNGGLEQRLIAIMATSGWEYFSKGNIFDTITNDTIQIGLSARDAKIKKFDKPIDMVVSDEVAGIISHENVGHPSEGDRIMGREAAQAGESYWKTLKIGSEVVGSEHVSVSDDPTILGSPGYYKYDDEGVPARKRKLLVKGIINEPLLNRDYGARFGLKSNSAARADGFDREPIIRMSCTFIEPGDFTFEELVEDVKEGIYMASFTEWNIDDVRYQSKYVGQECYLIENGEITKTRIKRPVLELTSVGLFNAIDGCSKNLKFEWAGNCGKGDPMQVAPVFGSGPEVRMRDIRLG